jgi:MFS family permease
MLVPGLVFIGMVVAVVGSLGAPLVPLVSTVDHTSLGTAQWSLTITFLIGAVATPTMGRLGDGPRRRTVLLVGLAVVLAGSILAALPLGFGPLLVGRALQGVGLGLTPMTLTVAREVLPEVKQRTALGILSITTVAGIGLGYPVTALIAENGGLHVAFWFGAAIAALALIAAYLVIPSSTHLPAARLDLPGAALLGLGLAALLLAISEGESWGWTSPRLIGLIVLTLALLAAWTVVELRRRHPLVDIRLLRQVIVLTADVCGVLTGIGMYLLTSTMTRLVQTPASTGYGLAGSVAVAGLMLTPFSVGTVASSRVTRLLLRRMSPGRVLPVAATILLAAMIVFTLARGQFWELALVMLVAGLGIGAIFAVMPGFVVAHVPLRETGSALSFNQVLRYVGYGVGSSASAALLDAHTPSGQEYPTSSGYTVIGLVAAAIWIVTALVSITLPRLAARRARAAEAMTSDEAMMSDEVITSEEEEVLEVESLADALPYAEDDPADQSDRTGGWR